MSGAAQADTLHLLADVASDFAKPDPARVRALRDAGGRLDREMWAQIAANGWIGIAVPEHAGGAGLGLEAVAIVARRLGYAGFPEPYVAAAVLAPQLLAASARPAAVELLERTLAGEALCAVAWQGPNGGLGPEATAVSLESGRLRGEARFLGLADADSYLVAAREGDGLSFHLVPADADGLSAVDEQRADGTADVRINLAGVSPEECILDAGEGAAALAGSVDAARVAVSAELVGLLERALEMTLEFMRQRQQFGRPIGSQQALQHRAVDAWIQAQLAAAALDAAIAVFEDGGAAASRRAAAASSAKSRASQAATGICNEALQMHGAIGFTDEYDLGLYVNRALALSPWLGGAGEHRRRYADLVDIAGEGRAS
ncbi:MAG: acyl-CoA dehydrogenase family protein [Solirubrobacterales bacterium]